MSYRFRIETERLFATEETHPTLVKAQSLVGAVIEAIECWNVFRVETMVPLDQSTVEEVFFDEILERLYWDDSLRQRLNSPDWTIEVQYRSGVTDNIGRSAEDALKLLGIEDSRVASGQLWLIYGTLNRTCVEQIALNLLANELIQRVDIRDWSETITWNRFSDVRLPRVVLEKLSVSSLYHTYNHRHPIESWIEWSTSQCWALNKGEIVHLRRQYEMDSVRTHRHTKGLPSEPTDVEVEIIAQSWSEHCKHKIFAAQIEYTEGECVEHLSGHRALGSKNITSLFNTYIRKATVEIERERSLPWLRSVFHDNAGVVAFAEFLDVSIKVETHNSPSALDPYGGAITGILGVNRDILGVGLGAKPIGNMDVFCFADPSWPLDSFTDEMPAGLKSPRRILEGVHKGVKDGGNMSGIPTVNGAMFFDQDYAGKPLVFVGTVGIMPKRLVNGRDTIDNHIVPGNRIVMVGGSIGADGIHGATFSSLALDEHAPSTAVQIGDAITQKRMTGFLMEARDAGLFMCITDNGAGGLSSSVGEMAMLCNGARVDLSRAPTKYPNLKPWELMISESQERMTLAVDSVHKDALFLLASKHGVIATDIGVFTDSGYLDVYYAETCVGSLDLTFLHESLPQMHLKACWDGPQKRDSWIDINIQRNPISLSWSEKLQVLLSAPNVVSKERWVRQYDHEVQSATIGKPFGGSTQQGPNDAGVLWLYPHGGENNNAVAVGCGLAPRLSLYDPYCMAQMALDEAIRNIVSSGADIDQTCVLDNFCWPDPIVSDSVPDGALKLGQLVRCCEGLYDICRAYGVPLVSGKDSMKNDFRGVNRRGEPLTISILPTLLVTAMGRVSIERIQNTAFKNNGDIILHLGVNKTSFQGSEFAEWFTVSELGDVEICLEENLRLYRLLRRLLQKRVFQSIHDISDGGLLCAVVESCIGNAFSANLCVETDDKTLFAEGAGQFIVSVRSQDMVLIQGMLNGVEWREIGLVTQTGRLEIKDTSVSMSMLKDAWTRRL